MFINFKNKCLIYYMFLFWPIKIRRTDQSKAKNVGFNMSINQDDNIWDNEDIKEGLNSILENIDLSKAPSEP